MITIVLLIIIILLLLGWIFSMYYVTSENAERLFILMGDEFPMRYWLVDISNIQTLISEWELKGDKYLTSILEYNVPQFLRFCPEFVVVLDQIAKDHNVVIAMDEMDYQKLYTTLRITHAEVHEDAISA